MLGLDALADPRRCRRGARPRVRALARRADRDVAGRPRADASRYAGAGQHSGAHLRRAILAGTHRSRACARACGPWRKDRWGAGSPTGSEPGTRRWSRITGACSSRVPWTGMPRAARRCATPTCAARSAASPLQRSSSPERTTRSHQSPTPMRSARGFTTARVTVLDAAHLANVEQADAFNSRVLAFINEKGAVHG